MTASEDYRVFYHPQPACGDSDSYSIREAYYDEEGRLDGWAEDPVQLWANSRSELAADVAAIAAALGQPTIELTPDCESLANPSDPVEAAAAALLDALDADLDHKLAHSDGVHTAAEHLRQHLRDHAGNPSGEPDQA